MKFMFLLLLISCSSFADYVFMHESEQGKSIRLQSGADQTILNDQSSKQWAPYPDITANGEVVIYSEGADGKDLHLTYLHRKSNLVYRFHHPHTGMVLHPKFTKNAKWIFYSAPAA